MHSATTRPENAAARARPDLRGPDNSRSQEGHVLTGLREVTADVHRRVEERLFPAALRDRVTYALMLQVLLVLHEPREQDFRTVGGFASLGIDLVDRRKAPHLRTDLGALGTPVPPPPGPPTAEALDLPTALGIFYVLEGSTLGGRVLLRQVRDELGDVPTRFLEGYGEQTGRRWRQTRSALLAGVRSAPVPEQAADRLIGSAVSTFALLDRLLDQHGWPSS